MIGELIAELNNGHAYVGGGGATARLPRIKLGLLGAELLARSRQQGLPDQTKHPPRRKLGQGKPALRLLPSA